MRSRNGCIALTNDERDFGRSECQYLKQDGFFLLMHKTELVGKLQLTAALQQELAFVDHVHEFDTGQDTCGRSK